MICDNVTASIPTLTGWAVISNDLNISIPIFPYCITLNLVEYLERALSTLLFTRKAYQLTQNYRLLADEKTKQNKTKNTEA